MNSLRIKHNYKVIRKTSIQLVIAAAPKSVLTLEERKDYEKAVASSVPIFNSPVD